jgi:hypothetical protein
MDSNFALILSPSTGRLNETALKALYFILVTNCQADQIEDEITGNVARVKYKKRMFVEKCC